MDVCWVVEQGWDYEGSQVVGVFSQEETAQAFVASRYDEESARHGEFFRVKRWEVMP